MQIRELGADDGMLMKQIRLRALLDAPYAFGGLETYQEESLFPDSQWHQLAAEVGGEVESWRDRCVALVVMDGGHPCGTAGCILSKTIADRAYFQAAWIDPSYRRRGLGRQLVEKAIGWALARGVNHICLSLDDCNPEAANFYRALGFLPTGKKRPVRPGAVGLEAEWRLDLIVARVDCD